MVRVYDIEEGSSDISNLNEMLSDSKKKIMYVVHKPGCPACNSFIPQWNIFKENMRSKNVPLSNIVLAKINVNVLELINLKDKNNIVGVPHISLQNKNKIKNYHGTRTPEDLEQWIMNNHIIGGGRKKTRKKTRKNKWSTKYKKSINCKKPKGFSQKQYCKTKKMKRTRSRK